MIAAFANSAKEALPSPAYQAAFADICHSMCADAPTRHYTKTAPQSVIRMRVVRAPTMMMSLLDALESIESPP